MIPSEQPAVFGIKWRYNSLPTPHTEITFDAFMTDMFHTPECLEAINYDGFVKTPTGAWAVRYYVYQSYALAVGSRQLPRDEINSRKRNKPVTLVDRNGDSLEFKYWRIGCLHPHMRFTNPVMFEHHHLCPDCGYHAVFDSSG